MASDGITENYVVVTHFLEGTLSTQTFLLNKIHILYIPIFLKI